MNFKQLIAKIRGFNWHLLHGMQIRTKGKDGYEMCPLVACLSKKGDSSLNNNKWATAGKRLGMHHDDAHVVIAAADQPLVELKESLAYYEKALKSCHQDKKKFYTSRVRHYRRAIHLRQRLERELLQ